MWKFRSEWHLCVQHTPQATVLPPMTGVKILTHQSFMLDPLTMLKICPWPSSINHAHWVLGETLTISNLPLMCLTSFKTSPWPLDFILHWPWEYSRLCSVPHPLRIMYMYTWLGLKVHTDVIITPGYHCSTYPVAICTVQLVIQNKSVEGIIVQPRHWLEDREDTPAYIPWLKKHHSLH